MPDGRMSKPLMLLTLLIGVLTLLSGLAGGILAVTAAKPLWFFLAFELIVLGAGVFTILLGRGRFADAPALTLLCAAGSIAASSLFGFLRARDSISVIDMQYWLLARWGVAALLCAIAATAVLLRRPRVSLPLMVKGMVFAALFVGSLAGLWFAKASLMGMSGNAKAFAAIGIGIWLLAVLAPATHYLIRAFEAGRLSDRYSGAPRA